jgi:hypothetical protein
VMSAEATSTESASELIQPVKPVHPLLGVFGVLLGAMIATATGRLTSLGFAGLRKALHLGVDVAYWSGTAFNASPPSTVSQHNTAKSWHHSRALHESTKSLQGISYALSSN